MTSPRNPSKATRAHHSEAKSTATPKRAASASKAAPPSNRFFNRDESWLRFNERVLEEAMDASNPILERVKFLAITASNLDEFVEIRVAGVLQRMEEEAELPQLPDEGGFTPEERLTRLRNHLHRFADAQDDCWNEHLVPELQANGIRLMRWKQLRKSDRAFATQFFTTQVDPLLTPVTIDPAHPFPRVLNKALCLALLLRNNRRGTGRKNALSLGVITVPRSLPRVIALPDSKEKGRFLLLDELIEAHVGHMFRGYTVRGSAAFRVTRNSNLYMQEEESRSVLESVRSELHNRRKGDAVRLQIDASAPDEVVEWLRSNFELEAWQVFLTKAPVNLSRLMNLYSEVQAPTMKFKDFSGKTYRPLAPTGNIFDDLRAHDVLLHHPFDSYATVEQFIAAGATDPSVVSMKQTLYRTSEDSSIFRALTDAAQSKDVTVVVELMARFDEASNIRWARELEDAGVQVFHGVFGYKTHCKLALIVRRDPDGVIRNYAHLGTGNYNAITARFYTDISLLTSRPELTEAVQHVFRYLTAGWQADADLYRPLLVAPITLAADILGLIARESANARAGKPASIVAKMNALLDEQTVLALYEASSAGVKIDLIIRGMCSLRPGVPGLSDNIRVRSIVGRFLEHSRIFWFANNGNGEVYAGSADWMSRNLHERCEAVFPITDQAACRRLREEILEAYLRDESKARFLQPNGEYVRPARSQTSFDAQEWLMQRSRLPAPPPEAIPSPLKDTPAEDVAAPAAAAEKRKGRAAARPVRSAR